MTPQHQLCSDLQFLRTVLPLSTDVWYSSQVSITLVSLHQECLQGNLSRIQQLKEHIRTNVHNLAQSQQEVVSHMLPSCILWNSVFWPTSLQRSYMHFSTQSCPHKRERKLDGMYTITCFQLLS